MSFSKTVSVCAALTTIFVAAGTGYKLSQDNQSNTPQLEEKVQQLEKQLNQAQQPQVTPQPVNLPTPQPQLPQTSQTPPPQLPPPPVPENVTP